METIYQNKPLNQYIFQPTTAKPYVTIRLNKSNKANLKNQTHITKPTKPFNQTNITVTISFPDQSKYLSFPQLSPSLCCYLCSPVIMSQDTGGDEEAARVWPGDDLVLAPPPTILLQFLS